ESFRKKFGRRPKRCPPITLNPCLEGHASSCPKHHCGSCNNQTPQPARCSLAPTASPRRVRRWRTRWLCCARRVARRRLRFCRSSCAKVGYRRMPFTQEQIKNALKSVKYPGFSRDIVSFGLIKQIVSTDAEVRIQLVLTTNDPA